MAGGRNRRSHGRRHHMTDTDPQHTSPGTAIPPVFRRLLVNTLVTGVTSSFLWFALTFWVYLETRSVLGTAVIGGGYMLLMALSGMVFGTFVDRHRRGTTMLLSSLLTLGGFALAGVLYAVSPPGAVSDLGHPAFWGFVVYLVLKAFAPATAARVREMVTGH